MLAHGDKPLLTGAWSGHVNTPVISLQWLSYSRQIVYTDRANQVFALGQQTTPEGE